MKKGAPEKASMKSFWSVVSASMALVVVGCSQPGRLQSFGRHERVGDKVAFDFKIQLTRPMDVLYTGRLTETVLRVSANGDAEITEAIGPYQVHSSEGTEAESAPVASTVKVDFYGRTPAVTLGADPLKILEIIDKNPYGLTELASGQSATVDQSGAGGLGLRGDAQLQSLEASSGAFEFNGEGSLGEQGSRLLKIKSHVQFSGSASTPTAVDFEASDPETPLSRPIATISLKKVAVKK